MNTRIAFCSYFRHTYSHYAAMAMYKRMLGKFPPLAACDNRVVICLNVKCHISVCSVYAHVDDGTLPSTLYSICLVTSIRRNAS